jgi:O-antigen ligase
VPTKNSAIPQSGNSMVAIGWACLLAGLVAVMYYASPKSQLLLSFVVLVAIFPFAQVNAQMHAVDWCMLLVEIYEVLAVLLSQYRANSISTMLPIAVAVLLYFVVRLTIRTRIQIAWFSGLLGLVGAALAILAFVQFAHNSKRLGDVGLINLLAFRSRLISPSAPWIPGEWFTLLLLGLPFAVAVSLCLWRGNKNWLAMVALIPVILTASALTLSLSRAIFWSTVLFFLAACLLMSVFRVVRFKVGALLLGSAFGALFLILCIESLTFPGFFEAYSGRDSSQVRSTQGRFAIWNRSLEMVRENAAWGVGSGNAALALTSTADQEETTGFASRTFSLPIQILLEKGIIGFLLYCAFLFLLAREFIRTMSYSPPQVASIPTAGRRKGSVTSTGDLSHAKKIYISANRAMACCFAAGLIAVLFRELTYSSLFEHQLTLALVAVLSALLCRPCGYE